MYEQYKHHGKKVWVKSDLKGKHREYCLCFSCKQFNEINPSENCHRANILYATCVKYNLVTPVWECPEYEHIG